MLSARFGRIAIGNVGVSGNGALYRRAGSRSSTGQVSPGPTRPVLTSRVRLSVLPGFAPKLTGEYAEPLPLVGHRVTGANRRLIRIAEHRPQETALDARPPRHADVRRHVIPVGVVAERAFRQLIELRHLAAARAGMEEIARVVDVARRRGPEMPQMLSSDAAVMMSLDGANGSCTSQRRPALIVSVGVTRHESWMNAEYSSMLPARRRVRRTRRTCWFRRRARPVP